MILMTIRADPKGEDGVCSAIKQLQFSYKVSIKVPPDYVKEKNNRTGGTKFRDRGRHFRGSGPESLGSLFVRIRHPLSRRGRIARCTQSRHGGIGSATNLRQRLPTSLFELRRDKSTRQACGAKNSHRFANVSPPFLKGMKVLSGQACLEPSREIRPGKKVLLSVYVCVCLPAP